MDTTQDFTTMNNPRFLYLAELHHPFPDWVVKQAMPDADDFEKKASAAFADPKRRLLPIATKSAAFHSAIDSFAQADKYDEETRERVKAACSYFGIEKDIAPYALLFAEEFEKSANLNEIPEGRYAIDTILNGQNFKLLPLNDREDASNSAFDLAKMAAENRVHFMMFVPAAREVVKAAADHGVERLPKLIERFGVERIPDVEIAAKKILGRENICKDASVRAVIAQDYQDALALIDEDPDAAMQKIATIDHVAGIETNYRADAFVPTPFDVVFGGPLASEAHKAARENVFVRDVMVPLAELQKVASIDLDYCLSKAASDSFHRARGTDDARDLSLLIENWSEADQRTLLRLAVAAA